MEAFGKIVLALIVVFLVIFLYAAIGCWLWAIIMVPVFGLPALGYWQMFGLMFLLRMLFGSGGSSSSSKN